MSGLLMGLTYYYRFTRAQRNVLQALADHAKDDGTDVRPGVDSLAWKLDGDRRNIQKTMRELEEMGVLVPVSDKAGGRARPTEYEIHLSAAQLKPPPKSPGMLRIWKMLNSGNNAAVLDEKGGSSTAVSDESDKGRYFTHEKGGNPRIKGGNPRIKGGTITARTIIETSENHQEETAQVREASSHDEKMEEPEPERRPMAFPAFKVAYCEQEGYAVGTIKTSKLMAAYNRYRADFDAGVDSREEASND